MRYYNGTMDCFIQLDISYCVHNLFDSLMAKRICTSADRSCFMAVFRCDRLGLMRLLEQSFADSQLSLTKLDGVNDFISTQASSIAWFLIIAIGLRLITVIAHPFAQALNRLPLIGGINRLAGLLLGMAKALIIGYLLLVICYLPVFDQGKVIGRAF